MEPSKYKNDNLTDMIKKYKWFRTNQENFRIYGDLEIAHFSSAMIQDMQYSEWVLGLGDADSERMAYNVQVQLNFNSARLGWYMFNLILNIVRNVYLNVRKF